MKKTLSILLSISFLMAGCMKKPSQSFAAQEKTNISSIEAVDSEQQFCDDLYAELEKQLIGDDFEIDSISSVYLSKEYIEEKLYNGQDNVYFGYLLPNVEMAFEGEKYVFAPNEEGMTIVKEFEEYDDTLDQIIRNLCIGTGVVLVCTTLTCVTGAMGLTTLYVTFAFAAKTSICTALSTAAISSAISGVITAYQTHDFSEVLKSMALDGSRGYKIGAIIGAIKGGYTAAKTIHTMRYTVHEPRQAELFALANYSGEEQVSFLDGEVVAGNTPGATRPDIIRVVDDHLEAIEVKRYDLVNHFDDMMYRLEHQVGSRVINLPEGSTQRIVLDVQGRGYSQAFLDDVVDRVKYELWDIYPDIPVDIQGWIP